MKSSKLKEIKSWSQVALERLKEKGIVKPKIVRKPPILKSEQTIGIEGNKKKLNYQDIGIILKPRNMSVQKTKGIYYRNENGIFCHGNESKMEGKTFKEDSNDVMKLLKSQCGSHTIVSMAKVLDLSNAFMSELIKVGKFEKRFEFC